MTDRPFASVVVITRNRAHSLDRTLATLDRLSYPSYEVVVVDNGSTDNTREVVAAHSARYVSFPQSNMSLSRQAGVDASRGDVIAMCDDDCVPRAEWLENLVDALMADPTRGIVGGHVVNVGFSEAEQFKGRGKLRRNGVFTYVEDPNEADYFGAANLAISRRAIDAVGGYDAFFRGGYEEIDLIWRIRAAGFTTAYAPGAIVDHHHTASNFKLRVFHSGPLMRLYFFLRHLTPASTGEWARFLTLEGVMLGKETIANSRAMVRAAARRDRSLARRHATMLFNSITARVALPWLGWTASRSRPTTAIRARDE